jgi:hypothetical protein
MTFFWSPRRLTELRRLRTDMRLTGREIAAQMGTTEGSVNGKLKRLGVESPPRRVNVTPPRPIAMRKGNCPRSVMLPPPVREIDPIPPRKTLDIIRLSETTCRWPFETARGWRYCGASCETPRSYCECHHALAYIPVKTPRVRDYLRLGGANAV